MSSHSTNIKKTIFQSLGIAVIFHVFFLNFTTVRISSRKIFLRPPIKFLGSFLTVLDTQQGITHPSFIPKKNVFQAPALLSGTSGIAIDTPKPSLSTLLPNSAKKTLPDTRIIMYDEQALTAESQDHAEPFAHQPLKLPDYDYSRP